MEGRWVECQIFTKERKIRIKELDLGIIPSRFPGNWEGFNPKIIRKEKENFPVNFGPFNQRKGEPLGKELFLPLFC